MKKDFNILTGPLDWGLGHASRCVPLIRILTEKGVNVIPAASGAGASFLQKEFPGLEILPLNEYRITYPAGGSLAWHMMKQSPAILRSIRKEHRLLDDLIDRYRLDAVISDNRFGLWSKRIPSIYITHQLAARAPAPLSFTGGLLYRLHGRFIKHFDECWIPDTEGPYSLAGDLAHQRPARIPAYFIGPQSRFTSRRGKTSKTYELTAIISGPEPQRSIFESMVIRQLSETGIRALVLLGKPGKAMEAEQRGNITICPHMDTEMMQEAIMSSELILCRSGYSSIMDLAATGSRAVLVPTPGQTEQEYLASYHMAKRNYYSVSQKELSIARIFQAARNYPGIRMENDQAVLHQRIDTLLQGAG
jgi:hypothetical protein